MSEEMGGAELMGGLFRQSYPHLVLLGAAGGVHGEIDYKDKCQHHKQLDVGIIAEPAQQLRIVVIQVLQIVGRDYDVNHVGAFLQRGEFAAQIAFVRSRNHPRRERIHRFGEVEIAVQQYVAVIVGEQYGDGVVSLDDAEKEIDV